MKSGQVWLFDTKTAGSDDDAANKHNGLVDFMDASLAAGLELHGGVLIKDPGGWRYPRSRISDTSNLTGWDFFIPSESGHRS